MSNEANVRLSLKEKIGYGVGDGAFNFVWMSFIYFQIYFYTDVFGISAAAVGTMLLLTRIWDTVNDPLMGMLADRTRTRWGSFRPYLLFGAIPLGVIATLCFTTPDLSPEGKLIYAYTTYFLVGMVYTALNIPYSSLMSAMTSNLKERAALSSARFVGAYGASILVLYFTMDLVERFGQGNEERGFQLTMALYGLILAGLLMITFFTTKERVHPVNAQRGTFRQDLADLVTNVPFMVLFVVGIFTLSFVAIRNGITLHYFKHFIGNEAIANYYMVGAAVCNLLGAGMTKLLTDRWDKKKVYIALMVTNAALMAAIFFLTPDDLVLLYIFHFASAILSGPTVPIVFAMYADIVDFSESRKGRRASGLVFAGASFSQKMGWTVGGSSAGFLLAFFNYQPQVAQSPDTVVGIQLMFTVIPGVLAGLAAVAMLFYKLTDQTMHSVQGDLAQKQTA